MKKNFTGGLSSLLGDTVQSKQVETQPEPTPPITPTPKAIIKTSQIGTKEGETRATFIVNEGLHEKIKAIAYWEREQIKDIINEALSSYVSRYEKTNGLIQHVPKRKQK